MSSQFPHIKIPNTATGEKVEFQFIGEFTPALTLKLNKRDKLSAKYLELTKDSKPGDKVSKEAAKVASEAIETGLDVLCMIMEPVNPLPDRYLNKRDLIADCLQNFMVVHAILEVFTEASNNSTASREALDLEKMKAVVEVVKA